MKAIYPGSFDPITYGHLDIIERASLLYEELVIVIMNNDEKKCFFSVEERVDMIKQTTKHLKNVSVEIGEGLTVNYARSIGANVLIRGIRAVSDYEYELQLASANMQLASDIETIFLLAKPEYSFLSSSTAKTIAKNSGDLTKFVPDIVVKKLAQAYKKIQF